MSEQQANYATRGKTIFRVEKNADNPFVMIDRRPIENPALSWRAKGILTYLVSRPDNWIVRLGDLVKRSPDGVYAVRGALKELKNAGHITRREERENGRFKQYVLLVHEIPITSPPTNLPQAVEPQAGNLTLNDIDFNENDSNDIEEEDNAQTQSIFSIYETEIGVLTPVSADFLEDAEKVYGVLWVCDAIAEAVKNNARNWKYIEAILKRWKAQGNQQPMKKPARTNSKTNQSTEDAYAIIDQVLGGLNG